MRSLPGFNRPGLVNNRYRYVCDPEVPEQEADMLARSPITRVEDILPPLMVVQGANDARVPQAESDNIVESLRARGVEVEYMVKDDEGHGFVNPETRSTCTARPSASSHSTCRKRDAALHARSNP